MIKRGCALFFLLWFFQHVSAQTQNLAGGVDRETFHLGFSFQYINSEYKIFKNPFWQGNYFYDQDNNNYFFFPSDTAIMKSISSKSTPGFGIGIVTDLRLGSNANLRFTPGLAFTERKLIYEYSSLAGDAIPEYTTEKSVQSTLIDVPLGIKIKSDQVRNFRAYILAGVKYSVDITSKKNRDNASIVDLKEKLITNNKKFLSYEVGVGLDLYFLYFKMSPEIKLSNSFNSVLTRELHPYSLPLEKLFLRNLQFSLFFE